MQKLSPLRSNILHPDQILEPTVNYSKTLKRCIQIPFDNPFQMFKLFFSETVLVVSQLFRPLPFHVARKASTLTAETQQVGQNVAAVGGPHLMHPHTILYLA